MRFSKVLTYTLASLGFTIPAAWLGLYAACLSNIWPQTCGFRHVYTIAALIVAVLILAPLGLVYNQRARRRATRGMYARPGPAPDWGVRTMRHMARAIWAEEEAEPGLITGVMRFEARGWWLTVEVNGGTRVWVDREQLWRWLQRVEAFQAEIEPGQSAIGERLWVPEIGRLLWMAYIDILEAIGAAEYPTADARSRRYVPGGPWGRVEEYEKLRPSEVRWG